MTKTSVLVTVPLDNWDLFESPMKRFCDSWRRFPPESDLELVAICCQSDPTEVLSEMFKGLPVRFVRDDSNAGKDVGFHQRFAQRQDSEFIWCMNSRMYFHRAGWGKAMEQARCQNPDIKLFGLSASRDVRLHIRSAGYALCIYDLLEWEEEIISEETAQRFELGLLDFFKDREKRSGLVYWEGVFCEPDWFLPQNIFRDGTQENMLVWDRHSDIYSESDSEYRAQLSWIGNSTRTIGANPRKPRYPK